MMPYEGQNSAGSTSHIVLLSPSRLNGLYPLLIILWKRLVDKSKKEGKDEEGKGGHHYPNEEIINHDDDDFNQEDYDLSPYTFNLLLLSSLPSCIYACMCVCRMTQGRESVPKN